MEGCQVSVSPCDFFCENSVPTTKPKSCEFVDVLTNSVDDLLWSEIPSFIHSLKVNFLFDFATASKSKKSTWSDPNTEYAIHLIDGVNQTGVLLSFQSRILQFVDF